MGNNYPFLYNYTHMEYDQFVTEDDCGISRNMSFKVKLVVLFLKCLSAIWKVPNLNSLYCHWVSFGHRAVLDNELSSTPIIGSNKRIPFPRFSFYQKNP